ncbi:CheR family methyltransferase [Sphingomonas yantingensis]|uniref:Chemotaxis protein methyltransferase CheR n=1 Tax=Sphingomonas yantingensis TaxID=1241761 RepID=A0A7W9ANB6_9SPHN|nr:protein-glutamate O-methyltransferase CheR [Sphingomonas yantingensis]MBB5697570.1 chemotaxis protein methyltransferase CheR [Sphingomonas yantingensis]
MTLRPMPAAAPRVGATGIIAALLEQRTGQQLAPNRSWRLDATLKPLLRERGLADFDELVGALLGARDPSLADAVVEALLNQETSFFRDAGVLEQVVEAAAAMPNEGGRLRIWSAGCSTGQEPLSLAMLFAERGGDMPDIQATDVSNGALVRARAGRYSQFEVQRGLPIRRLMQWFDPVGEDWVAKSDLVDRIRYRRLNLASDPVLPGRFDIILCRNVLLYFNAGMRAKVLDALSCALRPGGLLVLGAGETVIGQTDRLEPSRDWRGFYAIAEPARRTA